MRTFFVRPRSLVRRWNCTLAVLLAIVPAAVMANSTDEANAGDGAIIAVWKAQQVNFEYRGYSTMYSCRSLEDKLQIILRSVGAREDVRLQSYACDERLGIARFQIAMQSPVIASEENIRELTTHDSKDELVARVNGGQLPGAADLERFPAVWKKVSFARDRDMRLERGDCELVQQLRRQILPRMSVQVVKDNISCSSAFGNITAPRLTVSALVPVKEPLKR
jgi:hypothetical protein